MNDRDNLPDINFRHVFESMPANSALLSPRGLQFVVVAATDNYCLMRGISAAEIIGSEVPDAVAVRGGATKEGALSLLASLRKVMSLQVTDVVELRAEISAGIGRSEKYRRTVNQPLFNASGDVEYIISTSSDITESNAPAENEKIGQRTNMYDVFMQAPFAIYILTGEDLIIEMANEPTLLLWGKNTGVIGKAFFDIFPDLVAGSFAEQMLQVKASGKVINGYEKPLKLFEEEEAKMNYYNYVFQPYHTEGDSQIKGIIAFINNVTERVFASRRLADVETRFQQIANTLPLVVWTASPDGGLNYISKQWETFYGNPLSESLGSGWANFVHPDDVARAGAMWAQSLATGENYETEFRVRHADSGSFHWILVRARAIKNEDGKITAWFGSNTDIQDKKIIEENVADARERLRTLIEESSVATALYTGENLEIMYANNMMEAHWGRKNTAGKNLADVIPASAGPAFLGLVNEVLRTGAPYIGSEEKTILPVNGQMQDFYFDFTYKPLRNPDGEIYAIHHIAIDVTPAVTAKFALQESRSMLEFAVDATELGTFDFNPTTNTFTANDRLKSWFGITNEKDSNLESALAAIPEKDRAKVFDVLGRAMDFTNGDRYDIELNVIQPHTLRQLVVCVKIRVHFNEMHVAKRLTGTLQDITAQALARQKTELEVALRTRELADANSNLKRSNEELAQFAYIASHDLQEPLRKISVFAQMLGRHLGTEIDAQTKTFLGKIDNSVSRMINLVRDVLLYSELSASNNAFQEVNLRQITDNLVTDFELLIEEKGAAIHIGELPVIEAIPLQMTQLFGNLVSNALKFIRNDRRPEISISAEPISAHELRDHPALDKSLPWYQIVVADNGIGFSQEYAEQIFNIFQRLHGKASYSGTGIGLAMCRKIVQNHHGSIIAVGSDNGAVFKILLPGRQFPRSEASLSHDESAAR